MLWYFSQSLNSQSSSKGIGMCLIFMNYYSLSTYYYMSTAINSKRDQLRRDIVKKEKEDLFMQKRQEMIKLLQYPEGIINPVSQLQQKTKIKEAFAYLKKKLSESDYFADLMRFIDEGLIHTLASYLDQALEVEMVLQTIIDILSKSQVNFYLSFYNLGILEHAYNYLENINSSSKSVYILFKYTSASNDYVEALLYNKKHTSLMQQFMNRVSHSRDPEEENENQGDKFFTNIIFTLQNLVKTVSTLEYISEYKKEIYEFMLMLLDRRLFLKQTIGVLFEFIMLKQNANYDKEVIPYVDRLLAEINFEDRCVYNLFALIYALINNYRPPKINYSFFFNIGNKNRKVQKPFVIIIQKMIPYGELLTRQIPRNEEFWERLLSNPQSSYLHTIMLQSLEKLEIREAWIWRIYASGLVEDSLEVQKTTLQILNRLLRQTKYQQNLLSLLHLNRIPAILEGLTHKAKLQTVRTSCQCLLDYIMGPITAESEQK